MSDNTKTFAIGILRVVIIIAFMASAAHYMNPSASGRKDRIMDSWLQDVKRIAKTQPERFVAYKMDSLQCTLINPHFDVESDGSIQNPVKCQVELVDGGSVDFSKRFTIALLDVRLSEVAK